MTKTEILDWYCKDQEYPGCESCKHENHNRRNKCYQAKQLAAMLDELIQSAPDEEIQWIGDNLTVEDLRIWKQEASK